MKKEFYNIVCSTCDTDAQNLFNLKSIIRTKPEKAVEYVINDFNATAKNYIDDDAELEKHKCDLTAEMLEKLKVGSYIDINLVLDDRGNMYTWTVYKMVIEVTFPLDGSGKLEDDIDVKFNDDKEEN